MSTGLHLANEELSRMVENGVFDHLHGKVELIRAAIHNLDVGDLFTSE